jgi:hypothetical protein
MERKYHIRVNGKCACSVSTTECQCEYETARQAEPDMSSLKAQYPDNVIHIVFGPCPDGKKVQEVLA